MQHGKSGGQRVRNTRRPDRTKVAPPGPLLSSEGESGCLFDEIQNLIEPIERSARGEQHCGERPDWEVGAGPLAKQGMRSDAV
jgi:hypothetical protein